MLIPSPFMTTNAQSSSLSRRVNANSQLAPAVHPIAAKLIKKGEC